MKLTDKIKLYNFPHPFFTLEFFPPRTDEGFANLLARIARLSSLEPIAVSITWGAAGSTTERSLNIAEITQATYGIDTILHLTCTNMKQGLLDDALRSAKDRGIQNILALRGDPPRGEEYWMPTDSRFTHAIDLIRYIKNSPEFCLSFCVGVAAYPDGHPDAEFDTDTELEHLKAKVDAGAEFIITQLFYDVDAFLVWLRKVRAKGINLPVIPGIMPLQNYASFLRMTKLCGSKVPPSLQCDLEPIRDDDKKVKDFGITLATEMIKRLVADGDVKGVHFCTLNLERSVSKVLGNLEWTVGALNPRNQLIVDPTHAEAQDGLTRQKLTIKPAEATQSATDKLTHEPLTEISDQGSGEINNASTWDEYPNGRFGDFKSPAFGEQSDPWNAGLGSLLSISRTEAISRWGSPKSHEDLTALFLAHLHSEISSTPFSPDPLSPESLLILPYLEQLTHKSLWTVFSQPAVDGVSSANEVYGWGPLDGYVYQKGFVEFFARQGDVDRLEEKIYRKGNGWVHFFAANAKGELRTNVPEGGKNAVTWGVFPGQEIAQSTIIEKDSFLSWKEEAFSVWKQWSLFYPPESAERKLLESVRSEMWLVSIVHHDYKDPRRLWIFILDDL